MHTFFINLFYRISKHRFLYGIVALMLCAQSIFMISKINFEEDISQIIPKNEKSDITAKVLKQLNFSDKIIVIIENKGKSDGFELSETADLFLEKLKPFEKKYIKSIQGKINDDEISRTFDFVSQNLPLFLDENDYKNLENKLQNDSIAKKVEDNYHAMLSPTSLVTKQFIKKDPLGLSFIGLKKLNALNISDDFQLENNYVVTKDGRNLLLFIEPKFGGSETKNNEHFADALEKIKSSLNQKFIGKTEISYFGSPLIAVANAKQIKSDIQKTVTISMLLLFVLLIFYFKNFFTPVIIFIPTVISALLSLAFMYIIKDKISAISLSVSAILLGITIDYALHILTHYKHKANIEEVYKEITHPIIMSSATTAVSFLCLVFVHSEALKDLGIFAAITVMLSAVLSLVIIPHIYKPQQASGQPHNTFVDKIGAYPYERNKYLVVFCTAIIILSFFGFRKIQFNNNIGDLNYIPKEMKISEAKLEKLSDITSKSIYTITYGKTENEALEKNAQLFQNLSKQKKEGKILNFNSVGEIILPLNEQQKRLNFWQTFWHEPRKQQVMNALQSNGAKLGFNNSAFSGFEEILNKTYKPLSVKEYGQLQALQTSQFINHQDGLFTVTSMVKLNENNRDNFINSVEKQNGVLAIDRQQMNETFLGLLKNDFGSLINYSLIAVIIIFLLFFRNIDLTLFAVIPILLSGVVTAGILYFLGLKLNIFSTIVCTLIFGAGVDFNIFLTQAMQKELTTGENDLPTYRISIILALLTTVLAVGALVFAKHPALYSVSLVALIGMFTVVIISFALYPLLFSFVLKRTEKGLSPVTFRLLMHSVFSFLYYGLGGIIFSFFIHFFAKNANGKRLFFFKTSMANFLKSVLYSNPFVKKKVINKYNEDLKDPAIIIANHTSFLDTLAIALFTPKVVYLVNDWVYNSKVFGKIVRALGFYPVSQGIEGGLENLKQKVDDGFSLVVFPEAARSMDNCVKRFHKGAFYLAEKYNLDVLPLYIHGNAEVMPKNDYIIHGGKITVKVGERISKDDLSFGLNYSDRTKKINSYFRKQYAELRKELEDENYFRPYLYSAFLYKETDVVKEIKRDFEANKSLYYQLNIFIGSEEKILHIADDLGQTDMLLILNEAGRKITSFIKNEDKRAIAQQNYMVRRRNISYPNQLIDAEDYGTLLVSDKTFNVNDIKYFPEKIVLFKISKEDFNLSGYQAIYTDEKLSVYKRVDLT